MQTKDAGRQAADIPAVDFFGRLLRIQQRDDKGAPDICASAFTRDDPLRRERVQWEFIGIDCYCFF